jgi:hypothetical protein
MIRFTIPYKKAIRKLNPMRGTKSWDMVASTAYLPSPGQEKMISVITAPESNLPNMTPINVMIGRRAFLKIYLRLIT